MCGSAIQGVLALAGDLDDPVPDPGDHDHRQGRRGGNTLAVFGTSHSSWNSVFHGILFAVTLFIGFEAAASIGEEAKEPHKAIPVALIGSVALAGLFYLLVTYAGAIGFGVKGAGTAWFGDPSPMGALAQQYDGHWLSVLIDLVVMLDSISVALAFTVAGSRVFFALGRDGLLPKFTTRAVEPQHAARRQPRSSSAPALIAVVLGGITTLGDPVKLPNNIEAFQISAGVGSFLIEAVYAMLALAAFRIIWTSWSGGGAGLAPGGGDRRRRDAGARLLRLAAPVPGLPGRPQPDHRRRLRGARGGLVPLSAARAPRRVSPRRRQHAEQHHGVAPLDENLAFQPQPGLPA